MPQLSISQVARKIGLRPSAIRYYEQIGILPPVKRIRGQRQYDTKMLSRLAVIHRARLSGFTLPEIRELFFGFERGTGAAARWQKLSERKLAEIEASIDRLRAVQRGLSQLRDSCRCNSLEECGDGLLLVRTAVAVLEHLDEEPRLSARERKARLAWAEQLRKDWSPRSKASSE